jgi:hypothetical protein
MELSTDQLNILQAIAEKTYPILEGMCAFRKQGVKNKQIALVWSMKKQFLVLTETQAQIVLNELKAAAGI